MDFNVEPIIIDTQDLAFPGDFNTPKDILAANYQIYDREDTPKCSIVVFGYNRLEKTRYCVDCILKYTAHVSYELILVDSGSKDNSTCDFYQSVPYKNKKIIKLTKNMGMHFLWPMIRQVFTGKYLVVVSNDIYVTTNWLTNLLTCFESDEKIGFVEPTCSNVSSGQQVNFFYRNFDEMQEKAAQYNKSDPTKWEERIRLVSPIVLYSRPVLDRVGVFDSSFMHDYADDDYSARLRLAGYKLILCKDTWVCHDHVMGDYKDKDPQLAGRSMAYGYKLYKEKYHGIEPGDDMYNFERILLSPLDTVQLPEGDLSILAVDVMCGTPVMEIQNSLRRRGLTWGERRAFTTQVKYYSSLQSVCDTVHCDSIDHLMAYYENQSCHIVVLGEAINTYPQPLELLKTLYGFLKPGGILLFKILNTHDFNALLYTAGFGGRPNPNMHADLSWWEANDKLIQLGAYDTSVLYEAAQMSDAEWGQLSLLLKLLNPNSDGSEKLRLETKYYNFKVIKGF